MGKANFTLEDNKKYYYCENDLVRVFREKNLNDVINGRSVSLHALGLISARMNNKNISVLFLLDESLQPGDENEIMRIRLMKSGLNQKSSKWNITCLCNISSISRDYAAMKNSRTLPLINTIINAKQSKILQRIEKHSLPPTIRSMMQAEYNHEQINAITSGLTGSQLILIQGPPGTGKTSTILGLLSAVIHMFPSLASGVCQFRKKRITRNNNYSLANSRKKVDTYCNLNSLTHIYINDYDIKIYRCSCTHKEMKRNENKLHGLAEHSPTKTLINQSRLCSQILVCAPSNSALDEIVQRILVKGLLNTQGRRYKPSLVRLGLNPHPSILSVSLESIADSL